MIFRTAILLSLVATLPAAAHDNVSEIYRHGDSVCISSNGSPDHEMGQFPNRANPNRFMYQSLTFCFPAEPRIANQITYDLMTVGVTETGIPIRPYTAGYWDPNGRRGIGRTPSDWRQQAMHEPGALGMDNENGHVDRSGLYHYHGVSQSYLDGTPGDFLGYAPDGFEIHYAGRGETSSWQLRDGVRPTGPGGSFDGTFEEDFEYVLGSGTLDECNGRMVEGTYTYFATETYPFFPRCFVGVVTDPFMRRN